MRSNSHEIESTKALKHKAALPRYNSSQRKELDVVTNR